MAYRTSGIKNPAIMELYRNPSRRTNAGRRMAKIMTIPTTSREPGRDSVPGIKERNHAMRSDWRKAMAKTISPKFPGERLTGLYLVSAEDMGIHLWSNNPERVLRYWRILGSYI